MDDEMSLDEYMELEDTSFTPPPEDDPDPFAVDDGEEVPPPPSPDDEPFDFSSCDDEEPPPPPPPDDDPYYTAHRLDQLFGPA